MNNRIYVEIVDNGFIVETYTGAIGANKRVHLTAEAAANDVRGRLLAQEETAAGFHIGKGGK